MSRYYTANMRRRARSMYLIESGASDVSAPSTYTISGDIVDGAAAGIEGASVALTGDTTDSTTTDVNGHYEFTGLVDGSYTVTPTFDNLQMTPASRAANVLGDDVVVDDIVGQYFLLPWSYDVSDVAPSSGNIADQLSEWVVGSGGNDGDIVATGLADTNSFTPSGVTRAFNLFQTNAEYIDQIFPYVIDPAESSVRIAYLIRDISADNRVGSMYYLDAFGTDISQFIPAIDANSSPDVDYVRSRYESGTTVTDSNTSLGADITGRRWHWIRFEWNWTDNKVRVQVVRAEDSASIYSVSRNMHADGITLGHVPAGLVRIRLAAQQGGTNSLYAKLWLGTAADAWPT